jgi:hypothetical protein
MTSQTTRRITVRAGDVTIDGDLNDAPTADLVWDALRIKAAANTWADEIYFAIHVSAEESLYQEYQFWQSAWF